MAACTEAPTLQVNYRHRFRVTPAEFDQLRQLAESLGFSNVASGPMVRSSYHADLQANPLLNAN